MKLIAEALMLSIGAVIVGYVLWRLRLMILWAWRKRRAQVYRPYERIGNKRKEYQS